MNIAFPALLIFLFILPGLVFNSTFYKIENTPLTYIPFTSKTIISSIVTIILHTLGLWVLINLFHYSLDGWQLLLILISGGSGKEYTTALASVTAHHLFLVSGYLLIIYAIAYLFGKALRFLINHYQLDKFSVFEIDSPWYYLFKGYDWEDGKPSAVRIAATLEMGGKCFLYVGILETFFLTAEGNIDRLVLTNAMRRKITKDKDSKEIDKDQKEVDKQANTDLLKRFYPIDGDYFVLKYSEVKNLNVQFLKID